MLTQLLQAVNTGGNEFGPLSIRYSKNDEQGDYQHTELITYLTDEHTEDFASYVVYCRQNNMVDTVIIMGPKELKVINKNTNAQYLTFFGENTFCINVYEFDPASQQAVYFQADTNGLTDIFKVDISTNIDFIGFLKSETSYPAQIVDVLSTDANDKCPFVNGQTLVFASDCQGGYGGYDLYYSLYENGHWREPVNFGEKINSAYDEFCPLTSFASGFATDLLIFSSNRPEGQGGF